MAPRERGADEGGEGRGTAEVAPSRLSHIVAGVSGVLVLALLLYLGARVLSPLAPARIEAEPDASGIRQQSGVYVVPVDVRNVGDETASRIVVRTTLQLEGSRQEPFASEALIDYMAGGESTRVYAVFGSDPSAGGLTSRVLGFQDP
ncbi:MAG: hypothetical protein H0V09_11735 [Gemmatimonadetes bacterium]|nr:hypothetical protein [Gemmatimonadota bacterium]